MSRRSHPARFAPIAFAAVLSLTVASMAQAQSTPASTGATAVAIKVEAGPLASALATLARQTGTTLVVEPTLVQGKRAQPVSGNMTTQQAYAQLLAGSGLVAEVSGSEVAVRSASAKSDGSLPEVTVTTDVPNDATTEGTGSYTQTGPSATATGLALTSRQTPQSVSVVTRQQIEDQGYITAKEAMDSVTGIYGNEMDTRTYYYARGFEIDRTSYDGVVSSDGEGGSYGENAQDLAFYDRVEVVRGATGLLTGAGEPSATVNYVRKRADSKVFQGEASVSLGSWNNRRAEVDLSTPLTSDGRVRGRIVAVGQDKESFIDYNESRKTGVYGTVEADLTPQTQLSIGADYTRGKIDGATWGGLPVIFSDGTSINSPRSMNEGASWPYWNSTIQSAFVDLEHKFDSGWNLKGNLTYRKKDYQTKLLLPYDLYGTGLDHDTGSGLSAYSWANDATHRQTTTSLQASGPISALGRTHELIVGYNGSWRNSRLYNSKYAIEDIGNYYQWDGSYAEPEWSGSPESDTTTHTRENAFYAAARLSLADPLKLIAGGRFTDWRSTAAGDTRSASKFTPYVGVVYDLDHAHSLYASYTKIFNPQDKRDAAGNYLDPTNGTNYEIGLKGEYLNGRLNASMALFRTLQNNVATADGTKMVEGSGDQAYIGADGVKSKGIEAEVSGQVLPGWNLAVGLSRTISRNQDGSEFNPYMPKTLLKLATSYRLPGAWSKLILGGNLKWQNATYDEFTFASSGTTYRYGQSSFAVVGLMARYEFTPKVSLQVNVNNLFDKTYWSYYDSNSGTYGAPRNFLATLTYRF